MRWRPNGPAPAPSEADNAQRIPHHGRSCVQASTPISAHGRALSHANGGPRQRPATRPEFSRHDDRGPTEANNTVRHASEPFLSTLAIRYNTVLWWRRPSTPRAGKPCRQAPKSAGATLVEWAEGIQSVQAEGPETDLGFHRSAQNSARDSASDLGACGDAIRRRSYRSNDGRHAPGIATCGMPDGRMKQQGNVPAEAGDHRLAGWDDRQDVTK